MMKKYMMILKMLICKNIQMLPLMKSLKRLRQPENMTIQPVTMRQLSMEKIR